MDHFNFRDGELYAENLPVTKIAQQVGTPCYIYSRATLERHYQAYEQACASLPHLICYAVKANANLGILNLLARLGSGFDIVSVGELERVLAAGGDPSKVVFSGVGKQVHEIRRALEVGVYCFNVESETELVLINHIASSLNRKASISLRVNPDVDADTHPYISTGLKENKFGIDITKALEVYKLAATLPYLDIKGVDCHIGSQLTKLQPFLDALDRVLLLVDQLATQGIRLKHLDLGGGLGVPYREETPPHPSEYAAAIVAKLAGRELTLIFEPGRSIIANAGILVTDVILLKTNQDKNFAVVDAAMNDLLRPALYSAWQQIVPVKMREGATRCYDIVGPICETGDFLGKDRELCIEPGDLLAVRSAGAYGFSMSSNYNSRNRAAEVIVDNDTFHLVRKRETVADQIALESILPD
ncbi:MAG: diaminopimelate decarboxylase [Pseudomonadales bacterium]|nr:diaminopimelate decarboxylase [Pseudomonadales bacterium]